MMSKPTSANCKRSGCDKLEGSRIDTAKGSRVSWYCKLTGRIPGNMSKCPLEDEQ